MIMFVPSTCQSNVNKRRLSGGSLHWGCIIWGEHWERFYSDFSLIYHCLTILISYISWQLRNCDLLFKFIPREVQWKQSAHNQDVNTYTRKNKRKTQKYSHMCIHDQEKDRKLYTDRQIQESAYLLYISVSVAVVVQKTTAVILSFCFSRKRRTVPNEHEISKIN